MKRYSLNNQGSTLIIVILIMVVFSILFFSFISISMNTSKQNEKIEDSYQAMALAEMGVQYYQHGVLNIVENYKNNEAKTILDNITSIQKDTTLPEAEANLKIKTEISTLMDDVTKSINDFLHANRQKKLSAEHTFKLIESESIFPIIPLSETSPNWKITIEGQPNLSTNAKKIVTSYVLVQDDLIKLSEMDDNDDVDNGTANGTEAEPSPELPKKNEPTGNNKVNLPVGNFDSSGNYSATNSVINNPNGAIIEAIGNVNIGNVNNMQSMTVKTNGKATLEQALNANNFFLYAQGGVSINNLNSLKNSEIHVYGQTTMQNINNFENSKIKISGYTEMSAVNPIKNSSIDIFGNAKINSLENFTNSTVFVEGNLNIFNKIYLRDATSSVFVGGTLSVTQGNSEIGNGTVVVTNINVAGTNKDSFKVNGNGKLCIKDLSSLPQLNNQKIKATSNGEIIFLDTRLGENEIQKLIDVKTANPTYYTTVSNSDLTGSHIKAAGVTAFNTACGIAEQEEEPSEEYEVDPEPVNIEYEIDYTD